MRAASMRASFTARQLHAVVGRPHDFSAHGSFGSGSGHDFTPVGPTDPPQIAQRRPGTHRCLTVRELTVMPTQVIRPDGTNNAGSAADLAWPPHLCLAFSW